MTNYILNVESLPNWQADQKMAFSYLGISDRRKRFYESLQKGDVIITYVKATGFVDVREIAAEGVFKLGMAGHYPEGAWPWKIKTSLVACAGIDNAISPNLFPATKLCSGQWRYRFQQSGKRLDPDDGKLIANAIIKAARKARSDD